MQKLCPTWFAETQKQPRKNPVTNRGQDIRVIGARGPGEAELRESIAEVNENLGPLKKPARIDLDFTDDTVEFAGYESANSTIFVSPAFAGAQSSKAQKQIKTILQHEYGHAIFSANFQHPSVSIELTESYQELFADLLVVVTQKDPDAMTKTLKELTTVRGERVNVRGFSGSALDAHWSISDSSDPHRYFAPVRSYLWEQYFSRPENQGKEAEILAAVFEVISRDILARSENPSLTRLPPPKASLRLLNALAAALDPYKLK